MCFVFRPGSRSAEVCCHFRCSKKVHSFPGPPSLLSVLSSRGPPCWHQCACTQCAQTGLLAAWHLQLYLHPKLTLKKYMTCHHDFGLHFYTAHSDILRVRQQLQRVRRKRRKESNYKLSYSFSWSQSLSGSFLDTHCTTINTFYSCLYCVKARQISN